VSGCSAAGPSNTVADVTSPLPASSSTDGGSGGSSSEAGTGASTFFPDVEDVVVTQSGTNTFDFAVTISSPYDLTRAILAPSCLG